MSSAAQATCSKCGATMLAATAARTGGLCMACKQGIRQHIEAARGAYQQRRKPDAFRNYWTSLVECVYSAPDGVYRLSQQERTYFLVSVFRGEVDNGGIGQFFDNSSGDYYRETLESLAELKAMRCHALLVSAKQLLFPNIDPPRDVSERSGVMPEYPDEPDAPRPSWDLELERITRDLYTDPDKLGERLDRYALEHGLVQISPGH